MLQFLNGIAKFPSLSAVAGQAFFNLLMSLYFLESSVCVIVLYPKLCDLIGLHCISVLRDCLLKFTLGVSHVKNKSWVYK